MSALAVLAVVDGMRARELATSIARKYCDETGLQFLDGTVALRKWSLRLKGGVALRRRFEFQYSKQDNQRYIGMVEMLGQTLVQLLLVADRDSRKMHPRPRQER